MAACQVINYVLYGLMIEVTTIFNFITWVSVLLLMVTKSDLLGKSLSLTSSESR